MKRLSLILVLSLSLAACESMPDMSMPDWSALNPFRNTGTETAEATPQETAPIAAPADSSALTTEMAEMQHLTGSAPRFDMAPEPASAPQPEGEDGAETDIQTTTQIEETVTPIPDEQLPVSENRVAEVNAALEQELGPKPIPAQKPAPEPAPAPAPQQVAAAVPQPQPAQPQPIQQPVQQPSPEDQPAVAATAQAAPVTFENAGPPVSFDEGEPILTQQAGCPIVEIMPSARSITYFENEMSGRMVARAAITEIRGGCEYKPNGMEIDLDIIMKGRISELGRFEGQEDMEAFMTFPYFVSVSTPQGLPVDKQILATAMRFKPMVDDLDHAEKITQFIPLDDPKQGPNYKILIGFQLNREQLEYNRAVNLNRVDNKHVAPDLIGKSRVSRDPLTP